MGMLRRVGLFLATNFAVLILLGIVMSILQGVFGIRMDQNGSLLVFAAIFGFVERRVLRWYHGIKEVERA